MSKSTSVVGGAFPCPVKGCGKAFDKKSGLVMHNNRVHLKIIKTPGQDGQGWRHRRNELTPEKVELAIQLLRSEKERQKAMKNKRQQKLRADNIAQGLTSGGNPRKRPMRKKIAEKYGVGVPAYKTKERRQEYYLRHRDKMRAQGKNAHGKPYDPRYKPEVQPKPTRKKIQYVYPVPDADKLNIPEPLTLDSVRSEIINKIVDTYIERYLK